MHSNIPSVTPFHTLSHSFIFAELIRHLPLAKDVVLSARQELVMRLDGYCEASRELFEEVRLNAPVCMSAARPGFVPAACSNASCTTVAQSRCPRRYCEASRELFEEVCFVHNQCTRPCLSGAGLGPHASLCLLFCMPVLYPCVICLHTPVCTVRPAGSSLRKYVPASTCLHVPWLSPACMCPGQRAKQHVAAQLYYSCTLHLECAAVHL
jgi:hypothetical protein